MVNVAPQAHPTCRSAIRQYLAALVWQAAVAIMHFADPAVI